MRVEPDASPRGRPSEKAPTNSDARLLDDVAAEYSPTDVESPGAADARRSTGSYSFIDEPDLEDHTGSGMSAVIDERAAAAVEGLDLDADGPGAGTHDPFGSALDLGVGIGAPASAFTADPRHVNVPLHAVPREAPAVEDVAVQRASTWLRRPQPLPFFFALTRGASALGAVRAELRTQRNHAAAFDRFFDAMYRNIGQAWLDAGAPAHLVEGLDVDVSVETDEERREHDAEIKRLEEERKVLQRMMGKRLASLEKEVQGKRDRFDEGEREYEVISACLARIRAEGLGVIRELSDILPERLVRQAYTEGGEGLKEVLEARHAELLESRTALQQRIAKVEGEMSQQEASLDQQDKDLLMQIGGIRRKRAQRMENIRHNLRDIGEVVADRVEVFANGDEVQAALDRARARRDIAAANVSGISRLEARLKSMIPSDAVQKAFVVGTGLAILAGIALLVWLNRPQGRVETKTIFTWKIPYEVELIGEVDYRELSSYEPLSRLVAATQSRMSEHPSALLSLQLGLDLRSMAAVGFTSVLSERRSLLYLPTLYSHESVLEEMGQLGTPPHEIEVEGRPVYYVDDVRAVHFQSHNSVWSGDPDLLRETFETIDQRSRSLESKEVFQALGGRVKRDGCLWFILSRITRDGALGRALRHYGVEAMPMGAGVSVRCEDPCVAELTFLWGTGELAGEGVFAVQRGLGQLEAAPLGQGIQARRLFAGVKVVQDDRFMKVNLSFPSSYYLAFFDIFFDFY